MNHLRLILLGLSVGLSNVPAADEPKSLKARDGNYLNQFALPAKERAHSFEELLASELPSVEAARKAVFAYWVREQGLLAEESTHVSGLYRIGRDIPGLATRGQWVWEVRVLHFDGGIDGLIWINAHSKEMQSWGPKK